MMSPSGHDTLPLFSWPTPPYAAYPSAEPWAEPMACELEGMNGMRRECLLVSLNLFERVALIQVPPAKGRMALHFSQFRKLSLKAPLAPSETTAVDEHIAILGYRPAVDYSVQMHQGEPLRGITIGHAETDAGLFMFEPLDEMGSVRRVFVPRESYTALKLGAHIGQVLVEQHSATQQQVDEAAAQQAAMRNRKLGDFLVQNNIVSADQLMQALDQQSRMPMVRIGEALTSLGIITDEQLQAALERQKQDRSVPLGELLVRTGTITRQDLNTALARKMGYPSVDLEHFPVEVDALRKVPYSVAHRLEIFPLLVRNNVLVVAAEDPTKRTLIDELEFAIRCKVMPVLAVGAVDRLLATAYGKFQLETSLHGKFGNASPSDDASADDLLRNLEAEEVGDIDGPDNGKPVEQSDNSLVRLINSLIIDAKTKGASDIHIETHPGKRKVKIRFRKDGVLAPYMELPHTYRNALVARIKIMCDLDIAERRKPQDGKIDFAKFSPQHKLELRVATIPTSNGLEDVVMRLLASSKPIPMDKLGLRDLTFTKLTEAVSRPYGMVLCVGPTGSGKTTTLHSVLGYLNTPDKKIWTAEDPVEITQPDLRQVQVNAKIDWTFAKALRSFLRADPDIIMVGEIRDQETAQIAVEASLTGHLVLSTLHTNSAPETVIRLLDMGLDPFNFADSLLAVLAQRLVRRLCSACKTSEPASEAFITELMGDYVHVLPEESRPTPEALRAEWLSKFGVNGQLMHHHSPGCPACEHSGLKGRAGIHELLTVTPAIRRLIQTSARPEQIQHEALLHADMRTLRQDGIEKVLSGVTSIDEVRANCN